MTLCIMYVSNLSLYLYTYMYLYAYMYYDGYMYAYTVDL